MLDRRDFLRTAAGAAVGAPLKGVEASVAPETATPAAEFVAARPVWIRGRSGEKNLSAGFSAQFRPDPGGSAILCITASSLYRAYLNGHFVAHGPSRAPHGCFRVDEWQLGPWLQDGTNSVAIEVAGYNINSYYLLNQPAFVQAEVVSGCRALAATGFAGAPFAARVLQERVQRVQRYSFQRTFSEVYRLKPGYDAWRTDAGTADAAACDVQPLLRYLPRRAPYPVFAQRQPVRHVAHGTMRPRSRPEKPWRDRALTSIGPSLAGFKEQELETIPSLELQNFERASSGEVNGTYDGNGAMRNAALDYDIVDFGTNLTGFIGCRIECRVPSRIFLIFDEILTGGDVDFKRLGCVNIVVCELQPGEYRFESFEPYTLRYLKLLVMDGECATREIHLRELANPEGWNAQFSTPDLRVNRLFAAGRETFRQNAADIFMDCPSRERAGWLCDSFFTARAAADLCGNTSVEKGFLENYLIPERFPHHPDGMLPMCYPADQYDGVFIPNWALWFVLQVEEYLQRSGDRRMVDALRPKAMGVFRYLDKFRNRDGLLEKLEKWVFIEWSKANDFVQDVNYPSNMLYAAALAAAGRTYADRRLLDQAADLRKEIARQSFDGEFFVDNAVRKGSALQVTRNRTEVCQYFAFYTDVATPATHSALWHRLIEDFGPRRQQTKAFPEIHPANSFIGNILRLELLSRHGQVRQLLGEIVDYLSYMEARTGTLWENIHPEASCNHGFASHIVRTLYRDALGIKSVDIPGKKISVRFPDVDIPWCEGSMPLGPGRISLRWAADSGQVKYKLSAPAGFHVEIENLTGKELILE